MKLRSQFITLKKTGTAIYLSILVLPAIMFAVFCGFAADYAALILSITAHEAAHFLAGLFLGKRIISLKIVPAGFSAVLSEGYHSAWRSLMLYASGPVANLLAGMALILPGDMLLSRFSFLKMLADVNLFIGIFNLLPIMPLDGFCIMRELLSGRLGYFKADKAARLTSWIFLSILAALAVLQLSADRHNSSILIAAVYLASCGGHWNSEVPIMNLKNIMRRKDRLNEKGMLNVRTIALADSTCAGEAAVYFDRDAFHIVYVMDQEMNIIGMLTEREIILAALRLGSQIWLEEMLEKNIGIRYDTGRLS